MNAKQFRIVSVAVAVKAEDAEDIAQQLSDISGNYGFYSMGTTTTTPNRQEWAEIRSNVPEDMLGESDEQQRRDEKNGLYGGKVDDAN